MYCGLPSAAELVAPRRQLWLRLIFSILNEIRNAMSRAEIARLRWVCGRFLKGKFCPNTPRISCVTTTRFPSVPRVSRFSTCCKPLSRRHPGLWHSQMLRSCVAGFLGMRSPNFAETRISRKMIVLSGRFWMRLEYVGIARLTLISNSTRNFWGEYSDRWQFFARNFSGSRGEFSQSRKYKGLSEEQYLIREL